MGLESRKIVAIGAIATIEETVLVVEYRNGRIATIEGLLGRDVILSLG